MLKERKQDQLESLTVDTSDEWRAENAGGWSSVALLVERSWFLPFHHGQVVFISV